MDLTVDEMILAVDEIAEQLSERSMYVALEIAQSLRDELLRQSDDEGYED